MKSFVAWLLVNLLFVAINLVAAALVFALFRLGLSIAPELMENPLVVVPLGLLGIAGAVWLAFIGMRALTSRPRRARARAAA